MTVAHLCAQLNSEKWDDALPQLLILVESRKYTDEAIFILLHSCLRRYFYRTECKSDRLEIIYRIYTALLKSCAMTKAVIYLQLLEDLSSMLFAISSGSQVHRFSWSVLSEECCKTIIDFAKVLLERIPSSVIVTLYGTANIPLLSHICSTFLELSEFASWRAVRVSALQCLSLFTRPSLSTPDQVELLAEAVAHVLPGVSQALFRIVTGDSKIGSTVKATALVAWKDVLSIVFHQIHTTKFATSDINDSSDSNPALFSEHWYHSTRFHMADLISRTVDSLLHVHLDCTINAAQRLPSAIIRWLSGILTDSPALIQVGCGLRIRDTLIGALVLLIATNHSADATKVAREQLARFIDSTESDEDPQLHILLPGTVTRSRLLRRIVLKSFCDHIDSINSITDEEQLQKRLRTAIGYLTLLDPDGLSVLAGCRDTFHRLCTHLTDLLRFSTNSVELFDDSSTDNFLVSDMAHTVVNEKLPPNLFLKQFEAFRTPQTLEFVLSVAAHLARHESTFDFFVDTCRDIMTQFGSTHRPGCLLLITAALSGFLDNSSISWSQRQRDCLRLLGEYFDSDLLSLPTSVKQHTSEIHRLSKVTSSSHLGPFQPESGISCAPNLETIDTHLKPKELKENIITVCLLMEMFATSSHLFHDSQYQDDLTKSMAIEELLRTCLLGATCLASDDGLVGRTAKHCLRYVSVNCGYTSTNDLISENADFLVSAITLELHRFLLLCPDNSSGWIPEDLCTSLRSTCRTLETLFQYATTKIVPILRPLLRQILQCVDLTYERHSDFFLPALRQLMITCRRWQEAECPPMDHVHSSEFVPPPTVPLSSTTMDTCTLTLHNIRTLVASTRTIHRLSNLPATVTQCSEGETQSSVEIDPTDSTRVYPDHLHMVEETMLRCIHLMANQDPKLRLLAIDVLLEGFETLAMENELLLPLAHKVWLSLMARFRDQYAIVVEKAFQLLLVLGRVAGGFLRSRASAEIMSPLLSFLTRGSQVSSGASDSYRHLTSYRVQKQLLLEIGKLCTQLGLSSESLRPVVRMLILYLADDQPSGLQQASEHSLICLWRSDPGLVWTSLLVYVPVANVNELFVGTHPCVEGCEAIKILPVDTDNVKISMTRIHGLLSRLSHEISVFSPAV